MVCMMNSAWTEGNGMRAADARSIKYILSYRTELKTLAAYCSLKLSLKAAPVWPHWAMVSCQNVLRVDCNQDSWPERSHTRYEEKKKRLVADLSHELHLQLRALSAWSGIRTHASGDNRTWVCRLRPLGHSSATYTTEWLRLTRLLDKQIDTHLIHTKFNKQSQIKILIYPRRDSNPQSWDS